MLKVNLVQIPPIAPITDDAPVTPVWLNWFNAIYRLLGLAPTIYTGILVPTIIPKKVGDLFVDTIAKKIYCSVGVNSSADWEILN